MVHCAITFLVRVVLAFVLAGRLDGDPQVIAEQSRGLPHVDHRRVKGEAEFRALARERYRPISQVTVLGAALLG